MVDIEDVAHTVVMAPRARVVELLDGQLEARGYATVPLKGDINLLYKVNWESPFNPPPPFRCFLLLPDSGGWTTLLDQLDKLDFSLAKGLSAHAPVITVRGARETEEYEFRAFREGHEIDATRDSELGAVIDGIRRNRDHVTRCTYPEAYLALGDKLSLEFRGYKKRRESSRCQA